MIPKRSGSWGLRLSARGTPWPEGIGSRRASNRPCGWCVEGSLRKTTWPDWGLYLINYAEQALEELGDSRSCTFSFSRELHYGNRVRIRERECQLRKRGAILERFGVSGVCSPLEEGYCMAFIKNVSHTPTLFNLLDGKKKKYTIFFSLNSKYAHRLYTCIVYSLYIHTVHTLKNTLCVKSHFSLEFSLCDPKKTNKNPTRS